MPHRIAVAAAAVLAACATSREESPPKPWEAVAPVAARPEPSPKSAPAAEATSKDAPAAEARKAAAGSVVSFRAAAPLVPHGVEGGVVGGMVGGVTARREPATEPRSAGVRAGSTDDNAAFPAFLEFLGKNGRLGLPDPVAGRIVVEVRDAAGMPVFGAKVRVIEAGHTLVERRTYPDGRALLFPPTCCGAGETLRVEAEGRVVEQPLHAQDARLRVIRLETHRRELARVPLDVAFVLDTTGSMGDEIDRLRQTLDVIHFQLTHLDSATDVRFGLVEYKDRGDEFVTRPIAFTSDVAQFRAKLQQLRAGGGGDEPEDVQAGLEQALHGLQWRGDAVKVAFLIGDAPPHLDYGETFTYVSAMQEAARRGIKIAAVGCSGLSLQGEVIWREIAQYTMAPYVFLTRGERGDMEGSPSTVSHHTGPNWADEKLETIVVKLVKGELAHFQPRVVAAR